jgi:hypothetical protein
MAKSKLASVRDQRDRVEECRRVYEDATRKHQAAHARMVDAMGQLAAAQHVLLELEGATPEGGE